MINQFLDFCKEEFEVLKQKNGLSEEMLFFCAGKKAAFKEEIINVFESAQKLFDDPEHPNTVILTIKDYFLRFLQQEHYF